MNYRVCLLLLSAIAAHAAPSSAQVITGRVVDDGTGMSLRNASVTLMRGRDRVASVLTDSAGRFRIRLADSATYRMRAERFGYAATETQPIVLGAGGTLEVELRIRPVGITLEPLVVVAHTAPERGRVAFDRRRDLGKGVFLTQDSLKLRHMAHPVDALRGVPAISVSRGPWFDPRVKIWSGSHCVTYYVDHYTDQFVLGRGGFSGRSRTYSLSLIDPVDIVAVEVYADSRDVPAELKITGRLDASRSLAEQGGRCGVVRIWTKHAW